MKEIKLVTGSVWSSAAMVVTALILAGAAIFIALENNRTQWDIANLQKEAQIESSQNIEYGLEQVGSGLCRSGGGTFCF